MLGSGSRDARRTELYIDGLMDAEERGADSAPMDLDLDPAVLFAAGELRAGLVRVHPSFRFEEGLAARLALAASQMGGPDGSALGVATAPSPQDATTPDDWAEPSRAPVRLGRPPRPLVMGGVGVASAALSIGAVYVAWRWSRASQPPMVRAARAARAGRGHTSGSGRRAGVLHGILG
jgi:hypothetical protein